MSVVLNASNTLATATSEMPAAEYTVDDVELQKFAESVVGPYLEANTNVFGDPEDEDMFPISRHPTPFVTDDDVQNGLPWPPALHATGRNKSPFNAGATSNTNTKVSDNGMPPSTADSDSTTSWTILGQSIPSDASVKVTNDKKVTTPDHFDLMAKTSLGASDSDAPADTRDSTSKNLPCGTLVQDVSAELDLQRVAEASIEALFDEDDEDDGQQDVLASWPPVLPAHLQLPQSQISMTGQAFAPFTEEGEQDKVLRSSSSSSSTSVSSLDSSSSRFASGPTSCRTSPATSVPSPATADSPPYVSKLKANTGAPARSRFPSLPDDEVLPSISNARPAEGRQAAATFSRPALSTWVWANLKTNAKPKVSLPMWLSRTPARSRAGTGLGVVGARPPPNVGLGWSSSGPVKNNDAIAAIWSSATAQASPTHPQPSRTRIPSPHEDSFTPYFPDEVAPIISSPAQTTALAAPKSRTPEIPLSDVPGIVAPRPLRPEQKSKEVLKAFDRVAREAVAVSQATSTGYASQAEWFAATSSGTVSDIARRGEEGYVSQWEARALSMLPIGSARQETVSESMRYEVEKTLEPYAREQRRLVGLPDLTPAPAVLPQQAHLNKVPEPTELEIAMGWATVVEDTASVEDTRTELEKAMGWTNVACDDTRSEMEKAMGVEISRDEEKGVSAYGGVPLLYTADDVSQYGAPLSYGPTTFSSRPSRYAGASRYLGVPPPSTVKTSRVSPYGRAPVFRGPRVSQYAGASQRSGGIPSAGIQNLQYDSISLYSYIPSSSSSISQYGGLSQYGGVHTSQIQNVHAALEREAQAEEEVESYIWKQLEVLNGMGMQFDVDVGNGVAF